MLIARLCIGQTGRGFCQRLDEHKRAVKRAYLNSSAFGRARVDCSTTDWSNVTVLSNPPDFTTRSIQEAIFIRTTDNTLNRDGGTLPAEYESHWLRSCSFVTPPTFLRSVCVIVTIFFLLSSLLAISLLCYCVCLFCHIALMMVAHSYRNV